MTWIGDLLMGTVQTAGKAVWNTAKLITPGDGLGKMAGRVAMGSAIGAGVGFFGSESNTFSGKLQDASKGAFLGAAAGGTYSVIERAVPTLLKRSGPLFIGTEVKQGVKHKIPGVLPRMAMSGARAGIKAGAWGVSHPGIALGLAGTGLATARVLNIGGGYDYSPTLSGASVSANYDQQSIAAEQMGGGIAPMGDIGSAPQMLNQQSRQNLQNSTMGLTLGLHRARH